MDLSWVTTALLALLTFGIAKFYVRRRSLPPGPFPYPLIGNALSFFGKRSSRQLFTEWSEQYGGVITVWLGPFPIVFICEWPAAKEALLTKKHDVAGRIQLDMVNELLDGSIDVASAQPGPKWETLRKMSISAVRKFTLSEKLKTIVMEVTDSTIDEMLKETGPIDPSPFIQFVVYNVIIYTCFGKWYKKEEPEYQFLKKTGDDVSKVLNKVLPTEFVPFLKPFMRGYRTKLFKMAVELRQFNMERFNEHVKSYDGTVRDFTDAVLFAREEADPEDFGLKEVTNLELLNIISNLTNAGFDSMKLNIIWAILFLVTNPEIQQKASEEVIQAFGNDLPSQMDRNLCPYLNAIINETLRMRPPSPFGIPRATTCKTTIGGHSVPQGIPVATAMEPIHFDKSYWIEPEIFRPERFLDASEIRKSNFMPFGIGRRTCVGERIAQAIVFLVLARLLQKCSFKAHGEVDTKPYFEAIFCQAKPFQIEIETRLQKD